MKTNHYESVVIINAALEDEQIDAIVKRIEEFIKSNNGEIEELDLWGRKRLAYPIQKAKSGYYAIFRYVSNREVISKLERSFRLDENIIRYLTVVLDSRALEQIQRQKERKDAKAEDDSNDETTPKTNNESAE